MKTVGIIAEYNPFHNGHLYQINEARKLSGADKVLVVMSGDFTQRGAPAIYDKYARTRMALLGGADLVLEMPVFGSTASAADFADCGVSLLVRSGVADCLSFGSESGDLSLLSSAERAYADEPSEVGEAIRKFLRKGFSYPKARELSYRESGEAVPVLSDNAPNDILAVEYLRAIKKFRFPLLPIPVRRCDGGYHSEGRFGVFASATAVRRAILQGDGGFLAQTVPEFFRSCTDGRPEIVLSDFSVLLNDRILSADRETLEHIADLPSPLANRLLKEKVNFRDTDRLIADLKDRQFTYSRISRALLHLLLSVTDGDMALFKEEASAPWLRILGFRRDSAELLSALKKKAACPIVTKVADAQSVLSEKQYGLFKKHLSASDRYRMIAELKTGQSMKNEFTRSVMIV